MHILDIFTIDMRHVRTRVRMLLLLLLLLLGCCCCCHCKRTADTEIYKHIYIYTHTHTPTHTYYIYIHTHIYQCCDTTYFSFKIPRSAAISEADKIDACFTRCCMITAPGASHQVLRQMLHQLLHQLLRQLLRQLLHQKPLHQCKHAITCLFSTTLRYNLSFLDLKS